MARFNAMYEEYVKNPEVTKLRMFYETMEDVLPDMKLIIDNGDGTQKVLPLDSFVSGQDGDSTETESGQESADSSGTAPEASSSEAQNGQGGEQ